jgi:inorganic triphosphatase YgiF
MRRHARPTEVEWQLEAPDLAALARWLRRARFEGGFAVTPAGARTQRDVYFDTDDWGIHRAGFALRVRRADGDVEATLKAVARARDGLARRREISERLADARMATVRAASGPVGTRLRRLIGGGRARRLFAVTTRRRTYRLRHRGRVVGELALDRTVIATRSGRPRRLARLEVEVVGAARPALVAGFVATLRRARHLKAARRSKFEEGLVAARLAPARR